MAITKMRYGIDLGTTNSSICRMENGEPVIKKTDTLKDTLPSCVAFTKKKLIKVGDSAYNDLRSDKSRAMKKWSNSSANVFIEFKRTMGLDTRYQSSYMDQSYSSEELSAHVLKTLKSFISDDDVDAAVITIPAKFKTDQIAATKRAAELAGIKNCELLQEPIAASMAYGLTAEKKNGTWLVFDFGGGTFDVALVKVEDGVMQVKDTEGDNYLGGKNLDYAIVDELIIPHIRQEYNIENILAKEETRNILRDAMKFYAEQAKNQLSFKQETNITSQLDEFGEDDDGEEIELDMIIGEDQLKPVIAPIFQKAINITLGLLSRNNLSGSKLDCLILVGGPTHSPILREMLRKQITSNVDTSIDPMMAVAKGATLHASCIDCELKKPLKKGVVNFELSYPSNTVEELEFVAAKLGEHSNYHKVFIELVRSDLAWASGKVEIDSVGNVIECHLLPSRPNSFNVRAYDENGQAIPCFPNEITIIQGVVVGNAVLPYHIGVKVRDRNFDKSIFVPLKGLEKNQSLPAVGTRDSLQIRREIRPESNDCLSVPIYQGEHNAEGSNPIYNDHVFDVKITGSDISKYIPADSSIIVTIKVDTSQMMKMIVDFPDVGVSVEKEVIVNQRSVITEKELIEHVNDVEEKLKSLRSASFINDYELAEADALLIELRSRVNAEKGSPDGRMHLLADIRRTFLSIEKVENNHIWELLERELHAMMNTWIQENLKHGGIWDDEIIRFQSRLSNIKQTKDVELGSSALGEIRHILEVYSRNH